MTLKILFFGITQDLVGNHELEMNVEKPISVTELKEILFKQFPNLLRFPNFEIAVNEQYVDKNTVLNNLDVVAIIPPVSGG